MMITTSTKQPKKQIVVKKAVLREQYSAICKYSYYGFGEISGLLFGCQAGWLDRLKEKKVKK